ncbi:MAG: YIP1 family protein [Gemmatimonadales bacterium]|nr:YIP1 family protein [Gemmatimonadales bacterium]
MAAPDTAPAAPKHTPVVTDLIRLIRAPFAPTGVFEEQRDTPTFWMPWLIVSVLFAAVGALASPFTVQAMRAAAEAGGRSLPPGSEKFAMIGVVATPLLTLVLAMIASVFLWLPLMATGAEVRFRGLMCATIFAWPIAILQQVLNYVVLSIKGPESVQSMQDLQVSLGLDLLLSADAPVSTFVRTVLQGIGPLQVWSVVIVASGLMALEKVSSGKAWTAAIVSFLAILVVSAGIAAMFTGRAGG